MLFSVFWWRVPKTLRNHWVGINISPTLSRKQIPPRPSYRITSVSTWNKSNLLWISSQTTAGICLYITGSINKKEHGSYRVSTSLISLLVLKDYSRYSSVTSMWKKLNWNSLLESRAKSKAMMIYRITNNQVAITSEEVPTPLTLHSRVNTNKYQQCTAMQGLRCISSPSSQLSAMRVWNNILSEIATNQWWNYLK